MSAHLRCYRFGLLFACLLLSPIYIFGQDLGSSSKLFKSSKTTKKTTKKAPTKKSVKKKSASKKKKTTRTRRSTSKSRKSPTRSRRKTNNSKKTAAGSATSKKPLTASNRVTKPKVGTNKLIVYGGGSGASFSERFENAIQAGNIARNQRDYVRAETSYKTAAEIDPADSRAIYGLGNIYSDQQRWEEAEKAYRRAIILEPNSAAPYLAISYVLTQPVVGSNLGERYVDAEKMARKAISLAPGSAIAHDQLGVAMELRGSISKRTQNSYRKAIELEPEFALAYAHLGRILRRNGQTKNSSEAYRKAIQLSNDVPTMILVADVMQSQQRYFESEQLLRRALREDPRNPTALFLLGRALTTRKSFAEAERVLKKSVEVSPNSFVSYALLGSMYSRRGQLANAESTLVRALNVISDNEKKRLAQEFEEVGDGFVKQKKRGDAVRVYLKALSLDPGNKSLIKKLSVKGNG